MDLLLPSLDNLPVFYTLVACLLAMVGLSAFALTCRWQGATPRGLVWLKGLVLLPVWSLTLVWTGVAIYLGVVAGGVAGSTGLALAAIALLLGFGLLSWGLIAWLRGRLAAEVAVLLLVPVGGIAVALGLSLWICEPLAWSGIARAQLCTARLYESGHGGAVRNLGVARTWYRRAADQGVTAAVVRLGELSQGRDGKIAGYTAAADAGDAEAAYGLYRLLEPTEPGAALTRLRMAAAQGHAAARYRLGLLYLGGSGGLSPDLEHTRRLWTQAAADGYVSAQRELAIAYAADGVLFQRDPALSEQWERKARAAVFAAQELPPGEVALAANWEQQLQQARRRDAQVRGGDAAAQFALGREILDRAGADTAAQARGLAWLERAAGAGSGAAQYRLADHYLRPGQVSEAQRQQGRRWLLAAADGGHEVALRRAVRALKQPDYGFARDLPRARRYGESLLRALQARGVAQDDTDWLTATWEYSDTQARLKREGTHPSPTSAGADDPAAQYRQGRALLATRFDEGMALLTAAAAAGYPQAQYEMARRYRTGPHSEAEARQAVDWLEAAAATGHRGAQIDLGVLYLQGLARAGVARDPGRARMWFEQALRDGSDPVYEQDSGDGKGWRYTAAQVRAWLKQVP